jgi:hypothetical protein
MERTWWPGESAFDSGLEQAAGAVHLTIPQRPERRLYLYISQNDFRAQLLQTNGKA